MSATINEIVKSITNYKVKVSIHKNVTISNYYYFHSNMKEFNKNCLYVCKASQLPENLQYNDLINFLIVLDNPLPSYLNWWDNFNLILIDEQNCSLYSILENLQQLISTDAILNHFTMKLIDGIYENLSLDDLMKIAYEHLGNPVMIANSCAYLCGYYFGNSSINEPIWEDYIKNSYADINYLKSVYYDLNFRQSISFFNQPIMVDYNDLMNHRMLISSLRKDDFNLAHIYVLEVNKPFSNIDSQILNILNKLLLPIMLRDDRFVFTKQNPYNPIFYYLINNIDYDSEYVDKYIDFFDIHLKNNLSLIYLDNLNDIHNFGSLKDIYNFLSRIFYNHIIYFLNKKIFIIYNGDNNLNENEKNFLVNFLKENNMKCGISQSFSYLKDFRNAYFQCEKAISMGLKTNNSDYIYYFNDYIMYNLIFSFITHNNIRDLVDLSLINFINENNEEMVETLKVYCENNGDMQITSSKLHIHYNTLKYRLQKMKDLYDFDICDNNSILKLKLSFMAIDFLTNKTSAEFTKDFTKKLIIT